MTLFVCLLTILGVTMLRPPPGFVSLPLDLDGDGFRASADCSPLDPDGYVRWCLDTDGDGDGLWADGDACLPASAKPIDSRLVLTCE